MERLTKRNEDGSVGISNCRYYNYDDFKKIASKLADYEDAEEQGLLLKLHLKVGDTVYYVISTMKNPIDFQIEKIEIFQDEIIYIDDGDNEWRAEDFGKLIFLTREEAEKALADMGV